MTDETPTAPTYSMSEFCERTGVSAYTIRYYDKCGFFPDLYRNQAKTRRFSDADIEQLHLVEALRASGLSIEGLQYYFRLVKKGASTAAEREQILSEQSSVLDFKFTQIGEQLKTLSNEMNICRTIIDGAEGEHNDSL